MIVISGNPGVIINSDQESAFESVIGSVKLRRGQEQTMEEESPVQSSQSNEEIERTFQSVEGRIKNLASVLEERLGDEWNLSDCVIPRLAIHVGNLITIFDVGPHGNTQFENLRGKNLSKHHVEFGELVHCPPPYREDQCKFPPKWHDGVYLGFRIESWGVVKVRSIARRPLERRWNLEHVRADRGSPWKPCQFTDDDRLQARLPIPPNI